MKRLRRALLELWVMLMLAAVMGFLGPFGTYLVDDFLGRLWRWGGLMAGAYVLIRPTMFLCRWTARATGLPPGAMVFWGVTIASFPMAAIWRVNMMEETRLLGGYAGLLPFALLCAQAILAAAWWAARLDAYLLAYYTPAHPSRTAQEYYATPPAPRPKEPEPGATQTEAFEPPSAAASDRPRLYARLSPRFAGEILALESEDHYVRVHGTGQSELLLLRLRDAIVEMDQTPGEQTHRSWWVAQNAINETQATGRNREIKLANGVIVPVARDSVERLKRSGFLSR